MNIPVDKDTPQAEVRMDYPNAGRISVTPKRECTVAIRIQPWMGRTLEAKVAGRKRAMKVEGGLAVFENVPAGKTVELLHPLRTKKVREVARGRMFTGVWRGPDVVYLLPHGKPLRLYQRIAGKKKVYPKAKKQKTAGTGFTAAPTQQKDKYTVGH